MQWSKLFNSKRLVGSEEDTSRQNNTSFQRTAFEKDASRIVFSSAFRRLQGKTQVHSFPATDYPRTRLTHSLEVATIGQVIGKRVEATLGTNEDLSSLLYATGLAHDLGNPPFGHFGEEVMTLWLEESLVGKHFMKCIDKPTQQDYQNFNGNAQGFRLLTSIQNNNSESGSNLTVATLAAFTKYPFSARSKQHTPRKIGFFQREKETFMDMTAAVGMEQLDRETWQRSPLALLLEAADDISYLVVDLEDAFKANVIRYHQAEHLLQRLAGRGAKSFAYLPPNQALTNLRSQAIGAMSAAVTREFTARLESILQGEPVVSLLQLTELKEAAADVRSFSWDSIYLKAGTKIHSEQKRVLYKVMDKCGEALLQAEPDDLIYHRLLASTTEKINTTEDKLILLYDYVSGMSDRYVYHFLKESVPS